MRIIFTNIDKTQRLYSLQVDISIPGGPQKKKQYNKTKIQMQKLQEQPV